MHRCQCVKGSEVILSSPRSLFRSPKVMFGDHRSFSLLLSPSLPVVPLLLWSAIEHDYFSVAGPHHSEREEKREREEEERREYGVSVSVERRTHQTVCPFVAIIVISQEQHWVREGGNRQTGEREREVVIHSLISSYRRSPTRRRLPSTCHRLLRPFPRLLSPHIASR